MDQKFLKPVGQASGGGGGGGPTVPTAPQSLSASRGNQQVGLSWSAPASNGGAIVTEYKIYQSTDNVSYSLINTQSGSTLTVGSLANGTQYFFRVSAVNSVGEGALTTHTHSTPNTTPGVPTSLSASAGSTQVTLSWTAPTGDGVPTDYNVQFADNSGYGGLSWTTFDDGTSTATSATVTGLTNGTQYAFRVRSSNPVGNSAYTSSVNATPS